MAAGARLAEPGEFTLRAYLQRADGPGAGRGGGRLIDAVTPLQARAAFDQLEGHARRAHRATSTRELFDLERAARSVARLPGRGLSLRRRRRRRRRDRAASSAASTTCSSTRGAGGWCAKGAQVAIVGRPNVGKSSLFNALVGDDRAIVTAGAGTTRDLLTETVDVDGIAVTLVDTAGLRGGESTVEAKAWPARTRPAPWRT